MDKKYWVIAGMALCIFLTTINVEARPRVKSQIKFKHADKNKDGRISAKEHVKEKKFEKRVKSKVDKPWEVKADKNKDGYVGPKEKRITGTKHYLKTKSDVDKLWEKKADVNTDGKVDAKELRNYRLTVMDKDGNGKINVKERHMFWLSKKAKVNTDYEKKYDADGNGYISGEEAKEMLRDRLRIINTHGRAKVNTDLEREYDADGDGVIDVEEAKAIRDACGEA